MNRSGKVFFALALCFGAATGYAANRAVVDNSASPFAKVQTVGLNEVRWTNGFWAERFDALRTETLPGLGRLMAGTNYTHFFRNFEIAAGLAEGKARGAAFNDGDFYKLLEATTAAYAVTRDKFFATNLDHAISVIAKAQRADGYLHTPTLIGQLRGDTNAVPFKNRHNFEMYNMGHLFTTAALHHRVTGKRDLLNVAIKAADFLCATFSNSTPEVARSSVCPSHYMGIVELYRETREPRYLALAKKFFELRSQIKDGGDDNQDLIPFEQQTNAVGHAVRANYLYAGAADLFMETGDTNYWNPLEPIWTNLIQKKMYVTGGCGALYDGASPDGSTNQSSITRTHQAYGRNYQLPNTTAYNETCANIGNVLWNWRMFLATGEARFVDVAELALYNSVLSGVSLDGTNFFYTNPLRVTDPLPVDLRWSRTRVPFMGSFCCPPNLARTIAEASDYAYGKSAGTVWVNLYGGSTLATTLPGGQKIKLTQETEYPWNGRVRITIKACGRKEFALKLRIPGWTTKASVRINNQPALDEQTATPGSYFEIRRAWKPGDVVELDLPMRTRLLEANPLVEENAGQVAVQRGPVVYCLESTDLPGDTRLNDVVIPADSAWRARYDSRLLGGVTVLEGRALARSTGDWTGKLYRDFQSAPTRPINLKLIPYFVWGNRGKSEMSVWLPVTPVSAPAF